MISFIAGVIIGCAIGISIVAYFTLPFLSELREEIAKLKIDLRYKKHDINHP